MSEFEQGHLYSRIEAILQWPMMGLTVLYLVAIVLPLDPHISPQVGQIAQYVEQSVWGLFLAEYVLLLYLAHDRKRYLRTHLFEALVVIVPALRILRLTRLFRLARLLRLLRIPGMVAVGLRGITVANSAFRRFRLGYILMVIIVLLCFASGLMLYVERASNPALSTFLRCLWWGVVTMMTVGYGDIAPVTTAGRAIAMVFMLTGIGLAGVVTATVASVFVGIERRDEDQDIRLRFDSMERQITELRTQVERLLDLQTARYTLAEQQNTQEAV